PHVLHSFPTRRSSDLRRPFSDGVVADKVGVEFDEKKRIKVDKHFRTNVEGIYAIGDVIAGPMLAHKAEDEGIACVETIAGKSGRSEEHTSELQSRRDL